MEINQEFNKKDPTRLQEENTTPAFILGDEVIGYEGDATVVRRRMIYTPTDATAPQRMEAQHLIRKDADGQTIETLKYKSEKDLGLATEDDLKHVHRSA